MTMNRLRWSTDYGQRSTRADASHHAPATFTFHLYLSYEDALGRFYDSKTYDLISNGVADMHCFSDEYLTDELLIEFGYKQLSFR